MSRSHKISSLTEFVFPDIITGASRGLDEADVRLFAREGATVILTDVDKEKRVAKEIGPNAEFMYLDVRNSE